MYRLDFQHLPRRPDIRQVPPQEIRRISRRSEERGFFQHNGAFNVPSGVQGRERLVVTFSPTIYVALGLSPQDRADVEAHEMDHFNDFVGAARDLHRYLRGAVRTASWDVLSSAWDWFNYYVREDARILHRNMGRDTIEINTRPRSNAPY